jgi:penicillin-insensitive murein endopeptidase
LRPPSVRGVWITSVLLLLPALAACESAAHQNAHVAPAQLAAARETVRSVPATAVAPAPESPDAGTVPEQRAETAVVSPPTPAPGLSIAELLALPGAATTSTGAPADGRIENAVALPESGPGFLFNPKRPHDARYGTVELVQAIVRAAADVEQEMPGSGLVVNDLSLREGGPIRQHGSHQSGRDADILFYALDAKNAPRPAVGVTIEPNGRGWDFKDLANGKDDVLVKLDAKRTWRFMRALLEHGADHVQRIFLVEHVRSMLLAEAERVKAPKRVRERFEMLTCQPSTPHDDHMHVRFFCTPEDMAAGCLDSAPVYPFRRQTLRALGLQPVLEKPGARAARSEAVDRRTTSLAEARAEATRMRMHPGVRQFLARQEAWGEQPHPGRPYCK